LGTRAIKMGALLLISQTPASCDPSQPLRRGIFVPSRSWRHRPADTLPRRLLLAVVRAKIGPIPLRFPLPSWQKFSREQSGRYRIGKAPPNLVAAFLIAPPASVHHLNASCTMPFVHSVQLLTETKQRHDHVHVMREITLDSFGARAAFVA
jgi:hypothetical protein